MNIDRIVKTVAVIVAMLAASTLGAGAAAVTLQSAYGLAVDQNTGSLYIADATGGQIDIYNPASNAITSFAKVANPFSLAVNSNRLVYAGLEGATGQINVYNAQGQFINTLPTPPGDYPSTMTFDADNVLFEALGYCQGSQGAGLNAYGGALYLPYQLIASDLPATSYSRLQSYEQTCAVAPEGASFALAYDNGQVFVVISDAADPYNNLNVYDDQTLLSGHASDYLRGLESSRALVSALTGWEGDHQITVIGSAFAATVDASHNIFYTDPNGKDIAVTGKAYLPFGAGAVMPKKLLTNLPSPPYGIAFDKARSRLYVAFPSERLVRAYAVTYATQNGVKVPSLSMPPMLIK
jgi:DNA-binding beta-propeller fold protein YncE